MKRSIERFLVDLGIGPQLKGFAALREAIVLHGQTEQISITRALYPGVAERVGGNSRSVERNMQHAIGIMHISVPQRVLTEKLGQAPVGGKDTYPNGQFIALCTLRLREKNIFPAVEKLTKNKEDCV